MRERLVKCLRNVLAACWVRPGWRESGRAVSVDLCRCVFHLFIYFSICYFFMFADFVEDVDCAVLLSCVLVFWRASLSKVSPDYLFFSQCSYFPVVYAPTNCICYHVYIYTCAYVHRYLYRYPYTYPRSAVVIVYHLISTTKCAVKSETHDQSTTYLHYFLYHDY